MNALLTGCVTERSGEMGFTETHKPQEDDVGLIVNELETEEVLDLEPIDFFRPVPAEGVEGLDDREAGGLDTPGDGAVVAQGRLALDELLQIPAG